MPAPPDPHHRHPPAWPGRAWLRAVLPGVLVLATLLMPVSYRAGAEQEHPHTIFQALIDRVVGQPHHHGAADHDVPARSPFLPPAVPLSLVTAAAPTLPASLGSEIAPDLPDVLGMAMPISALAPIQALALVIAALLAASSRRAVWAPAPPLAGLPAAIDLPPPRPS